MLKKVYIIHGWGGNSEEPMLNWIGSKLRKKGFKVKIPDMPNTENPEIIPWVNKLKEISKELNENSYFIGHSIGCQAVLRFLETLGDDVKIRGILLIAPWMELDENTIKEEGEEAIAISKPWIETPVNWDKIKNHCDNFVCLFSDNDPYVPLINQKLFEENLGAKIIIESNKGHYIESDGINENQTVIDEIKKM